MNSRRSLLSALAGCAGLAVLAPAVLAGQAPVEMQSGGGSSGGGGPPPGRATESPRSQSQPNPTAPDVTAPARRRRRSRRRVRRMRRRN